MQRLLSIILLSYYCFGMYCLPLGDFSALKELPSMYRHCKATEDKDLTVFDFVTDHLIDIDCLFDKHDNGDEQKPHNPPPTNHQPQSQVFCSMIFSTYAFNKSFIPQKQTIRYKNNFYQADFVSCVFRPPIV